VNAVRMDVKANDPVNAANFSTTSKDGGGGGSMMNDVDACAEMAGATSNKQCNEASVVDISDNDFKAKGLHSKMQDEQRVSKANALEFAAQSRTLRVAAAAIRQRESNERTLKKQKRKNDLLKLRQAKEANKSGEGTNIAVQEKAQKKGSDDEMETSDQGGLLVCHNNNLTRKLHEVQENLGTSDEAVDSAQRSKQHEPIKQNDKKMESGT